MLSLVLQRTQWEGFRSIYFPWVTSVASAIS